MLSPATTTAIGPDIPSASARLNVPAASFSEMTSSRCASLMLRSISSAM